MPNTTGIGDGSWERAQANTQFYLARRLLQNFVKLRLIASLRSETIHDVASALLARDIFPALVGYLPEPQYL
jgi:hypothetical protein